MRDQATINRLTTQVRNPFYPLLPGTSLGTQTVAVSQLLLPFPQFTGMTATTNQGYSWYHSLQAMIERRFASGFSFQFSYTFAKQMDAITYLNAGDPMPYRSISANDRPHHIGAAALYELPFGKGKALLANAPSPLRQVAGGWELGFVVNKWSGSPLGFGDMIFNGDIKEHSPAERPEKCASLVQYVGRLCDCPGATARKPPVPGPALLFGRALGRRGYLGHLDSAIHRTSREYEGADPGGSDQCIQSPELRATQYDGHQFGIRDYYDRDHVHAHRPVRRQISLLAGAPMAHRGPQITIGRRDFLAAAAVTAFRRRSVGAPPAAHGRLRAIHTMVDMPDWAADPGKHFDPTKYIRLCREAGVEVIEFKAKNAVGDAMFPFRDRHCPHDWLSETRKLARDAAIEFVAYYNVGLDNRMALRHPEWCCVDPEGRHKIAFGAYNWMCLRSPWRDRVLDELRQMTEALRPEGVWFDLLGAPNAYGSGSYDPGQACFCPYCRAAYKAKFGEEQPAASRDPAIRLRANRFGHEARIAMLRDATGLLRSIDSKIELGQNGAGVYDDLGGTPQALRDRITYNSSEAKQHRLISFTAKTLWAQGKPYQVHTYGGFMRMEPGSVTGTWAAWNLIPPPYLKVSAAIISAHAGRIGLGVNPLPDGTVYEAEFQNVRQVFAQIGEREEWLADLRSVPGVALVYDAASELALLPLPETKGLPVRQETIGLHDALLDAGVQFDVVQAPRLKPEAYRVVILGDAVCPAAGLDAIAGAIRARGRTVDRDARNVAARPNGFPTTEFLLGRIVRRAIHGRLPICRSELRLARRRTARRRARLSAAVSFDSS